MGTSLIAGDMNLTVNSGTLSQSGPITVSGATNLIALDNNITLDDVGNNFIGRVSVDTPAALKITTSAELRMGVVNIGKTTDLQSHGVIDMGTSAVYTGKLKVNSGGFEIMQSGPMKAGADEDFDAGTAKIELFHPQNLWLGALYFKGGIIMINHPQLLNAVNAGVLIERVETHLEVVTTNKFSLAMPAATAVTSAPVATAPSGAATTGAAATQPSSAVGSAASTGDITIRVATAPQAGQTGLVQVNVAPETAAPGKTFSFEMDPRAIAGSAPEAALKLTQVDGKPLPNWLSFDATTKTFTAKDVPPGAFPIQLKVTVGASETVMVIQESPPRQ